MISLILCVAMYFLGVISFRNTRLYEYMESGKGIVNIITLIVWPLIIIHCIIDYILTFAYEKLL